MPTNEKQSDLNAITKNVTQIDWIARLKGDGQKSAILELGPILKKSLHKFDLSEEDKQDAVQASLVKILANLSSFKGKSTFLSWAVAITVNTALSELRKKRWKDISLEQATGINNIALDSPNTSDPSEHAHSSWALDYIETIVMEKLTTKQRLALLAEINGMPLQEIANRLHVTRGAVYKLTFDARKRINKCLKEKGLQPKDLLKRILSPCPSRMAGRCG